MSRFQLKHPKPAPARVHINVDLDPASYKRVVAVAEGGQVSIREFARQAIMHAVESMEYTGQPGDD